MHPSKTKIVLAIYGPSCVGKSTLATEIGSKWGVPVRYCGDMLKTRAAELGVSLGDLPPEVHEAVDQETRRVAQEASGILVIEGRYLDLVLNGVPQIKFVRLTCDEGIRELRFFTKAGYQATSGITLYQYDQEDERLRRTLYGDCCLTSEDWIILDTTSSTLEELLNILLPYISI